MTGISFNDEKLIIGEINMRKRRKGRGIDHVWQLVKYNGDIGIYCRCSCGYRYFSLNPLKTNDVYRFYNYCPQCGARKTKYNPVIMKIDKYSWE